MMIRNVILIAAAMVGFAVVHSMTAGMRLKDRLKPLLGERFTEGWYRLAYNLFSGLLILPTLALMAALPDQVLYRVGAPWYLLTFGVQVLGILGLLGALFVTDVWRFAGISQVLAYFSGDPLPLPDEPLQIHGMYKIVRHPLYFFSMLAIWPVPVLTLNILIFNVAATVYFIVGSLVEEQRLIRIHGDAYRQYRRQVSWLIPWFPRSR